jgi:type III restriction enzyme, res subunit family
MLIQLRNVSSNTLSIQTIGRIKRNPNPNYPFSDESIANQYFIYTNNDIKDSEIVTYRLRDQYMDNHIKFGSGKINLEIHKKISKSEKYKENILALFNKKKVEYYLKNALDDYNKNGYLDGLVIKYKDGNNIERNCVYQKIYNILELQKLNNKFQVQNSNVLTKDIIKNINS